jgi:hypothetical protein
MENSDTDNDTTDKDTDGTSSVEVLDMQNEEPGVNVNEEIRTDVRFKGYTVKSFAVNITDNPLLVCEVCVCV